MLPSAEVLAGAARAVHEAGGRIALQLFHAGRYAYESSFGLQPVAPSAVPSRFSPDPPRALDEAEILETIDDFARGAARAKEIGFDAVEVMASEGYLLDQFLSPLTNRRDDAWGGDFERRSRLPREVLKAIRARTGAGFPVIFRISGADLMNGSTTAGQTLEFARALASDGVDALNVGIGWHESAVPTVQHLVPSGAWIPYAAAIKAAVGDVTVIASNRINNLAAADAVLAAGSADFVSMARPFLADARIVAKAVLARPELVDTCIACNQACIDRSLLDEPVSCMVNPRAGRELEFPENATTRRKRRFAVVGGGPAGMESARALAALGHAVVIFESHDELGGQFRMARRIPGKGDFGETIRFFNNELARLGVDVRINHQWKTVRRCANSTASCWPPAWCRAASISPAKIFRTSLSYADVLLHDASVGERVAIVGAGGIGVDVAHYLSFGQTGVDDTARFFYEYGLAAPPDGALVVTGRKAVALMRRGRTLGQGIGKTTRWAVLQALRAAGVETYPNVSYEAIVAGGIRIRDAEGTPRTILAEP